MPPDQTKKLQIALGLLVVALALFLIITRRSKEEQTRPDGGGIYYTGPRRSKIDPNIWVNDQNQIVPAPPGEKHIDVPAHRAGGVSGKGVD